MGTSPEGVLQLLDSSQLTVRRENTCWQRMYSVSSYQAGIMLRIKKKGTNRYHVKDAQGTLIAELRYHSRWFKTTSMDVKMVHSPAITIRPKGPDSKSILIIDEADRQVLRIKHTRTFLSGKEFKIMAREGGEVGSIRKDFADYDLLYPLDLDVRFKTGLIATIIFSDIVDDGKQTKSNRHPSLSR